MKRFSEGEVLVYDVFGLCRVKEIKGMSFIKNEPERDYYVLSPLANSASVYYVPAENEKAVLKLRRPLTGYEVDAVLLQAKSEDCKWIENRQMRRDTFHSILEKGVAPELVSLVRCIYCRNEELAQNGRSISATDKSIFSAAEKLINEEFAFALGIKQEKVSEYISSYFSSEE